MSVWVIRTENLAQRGDPNGRPCPPAVRPRPKPDPNLGTNGYEADGSGRSRPPLSPARVRPWSHMSATATPTARPPVLVSTARSAAPPHRSKATGTGRRRALGRSSAPPRGHRSRSPQRARPLLHAPARPPAQGSSARSCWGSRPGRRREQRLAAAEARAEKNLAGERIREEERRGGAREREGGGRREGERRGRAARRIWVDVR